ncbi:MAG TPA: SDR family NAD(P)-dependent oxidoreductase [Puia sp.]|nr:SDR family NAD(P)-dependent oxidoreductase [Puia sp.]
MSHNKRFLHQHVLITGAARGIGLSIARSFAKEGATLSLFDNNEENLKKAVEELSSGETLVKGYTVDITSFEEVREAVEDADRRAPVSVLINDAGIAFETPFLQIEENEWRKIIDVNLTGMFFVSQCVCRLMAKRQKGVVVNMGSKNGLNGEFGYAHYNASKGGVIMLTKTMALELAHLGIRVNAVCPGYIETPMSKEIDPPEFVKAFADRYIPLNRPGIPEEVAPVFLFLASDESSFITGEVIIADGGQLAGQKAGADLLKKIKQ